jgi:two-component system cell cycle sensor histidine kinase/response regulator CckA
MPMPKILIVDDEPRMCSSLSSLLDREGYQTETRLSGKEAKRFLDTHPVDLVLSDFVLPDLNGYEVMACVHERNPEAVVIIMTGYASIERAVEALKRGAYDYIQRPFEPEKLIQIVKNALKQKRLQDENIIINGKLTLIEERYKDLVQNSPDIIYTLDEKGNFTFISDAVERLLDHETSNLVGRHFSKIVHKEDLDKVAWFLKERGSGERTSTGIELRLKVKNKSNRAKEEYVTAELVSTGIYNRPSSENEKKHIGSYGVARDVSNRKRLETQLQHFQKMETIATLAGGIAHDFNNLMMGIQGNVSLALLEMEQDHPNFPRIKNIESYVQSSNELTKQLLGFARVGKYEVKPIDINDLISRTTQMFRRTKKEINMSVKLHKNIWATEVDPGQIEQVLLNLYVNAWQAMPGGGSIAVETDNVELDHNEVKAFLAKPGKFVKFSVIDTGVGMDKITLERIFDPFFTTKGMGRGTGLGLASAYGIIKNHGGIINVHSKELEGATFTIYLPVSDKEVVNEKGMDETVVEGSETVLLVDDEEMILEVGEQLLLKLGYQVLPAKSGKEAVELYEQYQKNISIVILDMIMPHMGGGETYDKLKDINPGVKTLLSSGYSIEGEASEIIHRGCNGFIQKPFNLNHLSQKIREIID